MACSGNPEQPVWLEHRVGREIKDEAVRAAGPERAGHCCLLTYFLYREGSGTRQSLVAPVPLEQHKVYSHDCRLVMCHTIHFSVTFFF